MEPLTGAALIVGCVSVQAFFAGMEMGTISFDRIRLRHRVEQGDRKALLIQHLLDHPEQLLGTTLVGINIAVVISSTLANYLVYTYLRLDAVALWSSLFVFPLIIIFGEVVPMTVFRARNLTLVPRLVVFLRAAYWVLFPFVVCVTAVSRVLARALHEHVAHPKNLMSREELQVLLHEATRTGRLHESAREMIARVIELQQRTARDIMTPLINVVAAAADTPINNVARLMLDSGHSRIPIYEERVDHIVGIVRATSLIDFTRTGFTVRDVMRPAHVVPETKPIDDILLDFQVANESFAIVVDEYGGVSGVLTLDDIVARIVGEIPGEEDGAIRAVPRLVGDSAVLSGQMRVAEFNAQFTPSLPEGGAETLGGFLVNQAGRIPIVGEKFTVSKLRWHVVEATDRKIVRVAIRPLTKRPPPATKDGD